MFGIYCSVKKKITLFPVEFDETLSFDCKCQIFSNDAFNVPHE